MINESVLRSLFLRGEGRKRLTTTLTLEANKILRELVKVGKGGLGGPMISFALVLAGTILDPDTSEKEIKRLGESLARLTDDGDSATIQVADRLRLLWLYVEAADKLGPEEED